MNSKSLVPKTPLLKALSGASSSERSVTVHDVARLANVSVGTVSRVLNGNLTVKALIRERVLAATRELQWEPNAIARSMRAGSTRAVGCLVSDVVQLTAAQMITGAEAQLSAAGYAMFVASAHYDLVREKEILTSFRQRKIDGLILVISDDEDMQYADFLEELSLPIILWERDVSERFHSVLSDHRGGCNQAASYLLGLGHRRIALIAGRRSTWVGREMVAGYTEAHAAYGVFLDERLVQRTDVFDMESCSQLLSQNIPPTAVIATINDLALVVSVANGMRLSIPEQLSVISVGDSPLISMGNPGITAVRHRPEEVGKSAAAMMLELLSGAAIVEKRRVIYPAEFIVRNSCAPVALERKTN